MLNPSTDPDFTGKVGAPTAAFPYGVARDATIENDPAATPLLAKKFNDDWGFDAALLAAAGITPSGAADTALVSQRLAALREVIRLNSARLPKMLSGAVADPLAKVGDLVEVTDRAGYTFVYVLAATVTPNPYTKIQCTGNPLLALVLTFYGPLNLYACGVKGDYLLVGGAVNPSPTDDHPAVLAAEDLILETRNGEGTLYAPNAWFFMLSNWELRQGISLEGEGSDQSVFVKTNVTSDSRGRNTIIAVYDRNRFRVKDVGTSGDRLRNPGTGVVTVTTYGMMLQGCSYYRVDTVRNWQSIHGMWIKTCWLGNIDSPVSQQCQQQGFRIETASTSTVITDPTSWGCGGHIIMVGCLYSLINSGAVDQSDAGGKIDDPFLPTGSGGDYLNPSYIFEVTSSQGITINSPGTESGYSKYFRGEGAYVVINSPYCFSLQGFAANWNFIELRGTGVSELILNNPYFVGVSNTLSPSANRRGIFVEDPTVQKVKISRFLKLSDTFGAFEYSPTGIQYAYTDHAVKIDQTSMVVGGGVPMVVTAGAGSIAVSAVGSAKTATFSSTVDNTFFAVPLERKGTIKISTAGTYASSFDVIRMQVREVGGAVLKEYTLINTDEYFTLTSSVDVEFAIKKGKPGDTMSFTKISILNIR
jgi:hypothetical protein